MTEQAILQEIREALQEHTPFNEIQIEAASGYVIAMWADRLGKLSDAHAMCVLRVFHSFCPEISQHPVVKELVDPKHTAIVARWNLN